MGKQNGKIKQLLHNVAESLTVICAFLDAVKEQEEALNITKRGKIDITITLKSGEFSYQRRTSIGNNYLIPSNLIMHTIKDYKEKKD